MSRIKEVLASRSDFTVADFEALQHDDLSLLARHLVPQLVAAAQRLGKRDSQAVQMLARWNFRMSRDASAPLLFEAWAPILARRANAMRFPAEAAAVIGNRADYEELEEFLAAPAGAVSAAARDSLMVGAFAEAVAEVTRRFGADTTKWRWGTVHVAELQHPLARAFDLPPVSRAGDGNTVFATGGANFQQTAGASYREVIDLGDFDNSVAINVPGQSAQPGSEYYDDLLPLWGNDKYFPLVSRAPRGSGDEACAQLPCRSGTGIGNREREQLPRMLITERHPSVPARLPYSRSRSPFPVLMRRLLNNLTFRVLVAITLGIMLGVVAPGTAEGDEAARRHVRESREDGHRADHLPHDRARHRQHARPEKVGRVGGKALLYFEIVTTFALAIGLIVVNVIEARRRPRRQRARQGRHLAVHRRRARR